MNERNSTTSFENLQILSEVIEAARECECRNQQLYDNYQRWTKKTPYYIQIKDSNEDHLRYRLGLAEKIGRDHSPLIGGHHPDSRYHGISEDHHEEKPDANLRQSQKAQEDRCHQYLVGKLIEKLSQIGYQTALSGYSSVEEVRQCRDDEDHGRQKV